MALMDYVSDAVNRFTPQKREKLPEPVTTASGGIGHFAMHEEDMILSKFTLGLHTAQIFFMFLAMCCFAAVASFQSKWIGGPSGLSGFEIFITILSIALSVFLIAVPVAYEKYDKGARLARALREIRVQFILTGAGIAIAPMAAMIATISAWTQAGCKDPKKDPHAEKLGDDFTNGLPGWCRTKKAGAIFLWLAAAAYIASFVYVFYNWRLNKNTYSNGPRDPPFVHPEDASHEVDDVEDPYTRPRVGELPPRIPDEVTSPFDDSNRYSGYNAPARQSMDPYGAFTDDAPTGYGGQPGAAPAGPGVSRTMQYADPYAAARGHVTQGQAPAYDSYAGDDYGSGGGGYRR